MIRLLLLRSDLVSARIALADFEAAKREALADGSTGESFQRIFHHAKVFIIAIRRFARMLEVLKAKGRDYHPTVATTVSLSWKRNATFLDQYRRARNVIEHADGYVNGSNLRFSNVTTDRFEAVDGVAVTVSAAALRTVEAIWTDIETQQHRCADLERPSSVLRAFLRTLTARSVYLELSRTARRATSAGA